MLASDDRRTGELRRSGLQAASHCRMICGDWRGAGQVAACDPGANPRRLNSGRLQVPELSSRALVDHMGGCAIALGRAAGEVAFDVGAEAHAAARDEGERGERDETDFGGHDDQPFGLDGAAVRKARSAAAGR